MYGRTDWRTKERHISLERQTVSSWTDGQVDRLIDLPISLSKYYDEGFIFMIDTNTLAPCIALMLYDSKSYSIDDNGVTMLLYNSAQYTIA